MGIVFGIERREEVVFTGGVVYFHNLGHVAQRGHHLFGAQRVGEHKADIGTGVIAQRGGIYLGFKTLDQSERGEFLNALMNGCAGNITLACNFKIRLASVVYQQLKYLSVEFVELC